MKKGRPNGSKIEYDRERHARLRDEKKAREVEQSVQYRRSKHSRQKKRGYRFLALYNFYSLCEHIPVAPV